MTKQEFSEKVQALADYRNKIEDIINEITNFLDKPGQSDVTEQLLEDIGDMLTIGNFDIYSMTPQEITDAYAHLFKN